MRSRKSPPEGNAARLRRRPKVSAKPLRTVELAHVHLKLSTRIEPTWDNPEPEAYITSLRGGIFVASAQEERDIEVGSICAFYVHLEHAFDDGASWFNVLNAYSVDTELYLPLLEHDGFCYAAWVQSELEPLGCDLLILDRIWIAPEHRGRGYGLYAAELMMNGFGPSTGLVACIPAPYELVKESVPTSKTPTDPVRSTGDGCRPGWGPAEAKLREHWSLLGFRQVPGSDVFALSLALRRPSIESVIRSYVANKKHTAGALGSISS